MKKWPFSAFVLFEISCNIISCINNRKTEIVYFLLGHYFPFSKTLAKPAGSSEKTPENGRKVIISCSGILPIPARTTRIPPPDMITVLLLPFSGVLPSEMTTLPRVPDRNPRNRGLSFVHSENLLTDYPEITKISVAAN